MRLKRHTLFSDVSVILFYILIYFFDVTTITLERLNYSEPNFHT